MDVPPRALQQQVEARRGADVDQCQRCAVGIGGNGAERGHQVGAAAHLVGLHDALPHEGRDRIGVRHAEALELTGQLPRRLLASFDSRIAGRERTLGILRQQPLDRGEQQIRNGLADPALARERQ